MDIDSSEPARQCAIDSQAPARSQRTAPVLEHVLDLPVRLTRSRVIGDKPPAVPALCWVHLHHRPDKRESSLVLDAEGLVIHADVIQGRINTFGLRIIGDRLHVLGTLCRGADTLDVFTCLGHPLGVNFRPSRVQVDPGGPVDRGVILVGSYQFSVATIQDIDKAVAVKMNERRDGVTATVEIEKHAFVDAIVIPAVVGCHLICPCCHAGIRVTREDGHGPFIVARSLSRIPRARIAAAIVEQV